MDSGPFPPATTGNHSAPGQHFVYNVAFARIFGTGMDLKVGLKKVLADLFCHVPCRPVFFFLLFAWDIEKLIDLVMWLGYFGGYSQTQNRLLCVSLTNGLTSYLTKGSKSFRCSSGLATSNLKRFEVPFMYLPLYYMFEDTALGVGNPQSGLQRWWKELPGTMAAYCKIFPMRLS